MKIALCYFTYKLDAELLKQSLRSVARLKELRPDVTVDTYIYDDESSPLDEAPKGVIYTQTAWDRQGNLNGIENLDGMLSVYRAHTGYDWVVKADCDTYINDWDWLDNIDPETVAKVGMYNYQHFQHGCLYAFSRAGIAAVTEVLLREGVRERVAGCNCCEDRVLSTLADMSGMRGVRYLVSSSNIPGSCRGGYQDFTWDGIVPRERLENPDPEKMLTHMSVTFKRNSHVRTTEERVQDRVEALERMTAYADWVDEHDAKTQNA